MSPMARLGDIAEINPRALGELRQRSEHEEVPFLPMASVSEAGLASFAEWRPISSVIKGYTFLRKGDVIVAKITPCLENGKAADLSDLPAEVGFGSTEFHVLRAGPDVDVRYLFHAVWNPGFRLSAGQQMTGSAGQKRFPASRLASWCIPLPPLPEQRRIAAILDKADAIRRKRRESLGLLDELLRSAFLKMFGDPVRNERGWEVVRLGEGARVDRGRFTPRPRNDPRFYGGKHPFIQTGDISRSDGSLDVWTQTLNSTGTAVSRGFPSGSIAMAIAANIGDTAVVNFEFYCPDSVVVIVPDHDLVLSGYLEYCLRFFKKTLEASAPQTAQRNINLGVLRPLRVPVPPLDRQRAFVTIRATTEMLKARIRESIQCSDDLFNCLSQRAFRGEL